MCIEDKKCLSLSAYVRTKINYVMCVPYEFDYSNLWVRVFSSIYSYQSARGGFNINYTFFLMFVAYFFLNFVYHYVDCVVQDDSGHKSNR